MISNAALKHWLTDMEGILQDVSVSVRNLKRLNWPMNEKEAAILRQDFFIDYAQVLRFSIVVQLCKLLVRNPYQKRNFFRLFNSLKQEKYDGRLKQVLKENRGKSGRYSNKLSLKEGIKALQKDLEQQKELIRKLQIVRDKFFAHTDPSARWPEIRDEDLVKLYRLALETCNALNKGIYNREFIPRERGKQDLEQILLTLSSAS